MELALLILVDGRDGGAEGGLLIAPGVGRLVGGLASPWASSPPLDTSLRAGVAFLKGKPPDSTGVGAVGAPT